MLHACANDPNPRRTHGGCRRACGFMRLVRNDWRRSMRYGRRKRRMTYSKTAADSWWPLRAVFARHGWEHCLQDDDTRLFLRHPAHTSFQRLKPCRRTRVWSTCAACENHFGNTNGDGVLNREQPTSFRESPVISFRPPSFASNQTGTIVHCTIIVVTRALTPWKYRKIHSTDTGLKKRPNKVNFVFPFRNPWAETWKRELAVHLHYD